MTPNAPDRETTFIVDSRLRAEPYLLFAERVWSREDSLPDVERLACAAPMDIAERRLSDDVLAGYSIEQACESHEKDPGKQFLGHRVQQGTMDPWI